MRGVKIILAGLLLTLPLLLASLLLASGASAQDYEGLLDRGLKSDEPYSYTLILKAREASSDDKIKLLEEAARISPDLPAVYSELSKASFPDIFKSIDYAIQGLKAYKRNFWWLFSLAGTLYVSLLVSFSLTLLIAASLRLWMELPLIAHDISETKGKMVLPLLLVPFSLLGPLFFAVWALFLAGLYMRKIDKGVVYAGLLLAALSPFFINLANLFYSAPSPEARAIVEVEEGKDNGYAIQALVGRGDFASKFSYALALKRTGVYDGAIAVYEEVLDSNPMVYINLANAYAVSGQMDKAKEYYKKANDIKPSPAVLYNLSQVYRDTLDYQTGDKYFNEAITLDRDKISKFSAISTRNPNRLVIDETLSMGDLWSAVRGFRKGVVNPFNVNPYAASVLALAALIGFYAADGKIRFRAFRCSRCGSVVCNRCIKTVQRGQMCADCYNSLVKLVDVDPAERVAKLLEAQDKKNRKVRIMRLLSIAPPGIVQIYTGRILMGALFLWPFLFAVATVILNPVIKTGLLGFSHGWLNPIMVFIIVAMYVLNVFEARRLESE